MQLIDGKEITIHQTRFTGRLDVPDEEIEKLALDNVVVMIVSARNGGADLKTLDSGDIRRTDVLKVDDMKVLDGEMREQAIRFLFSSGGYVDFGEPEADDPYIPYNDPPALVKEADPELERLLAEEEEIERSVREAHDGPTKADLAHDGPPFGDEDPNYNPRLAPAPQSDAVKALLDNAARARKQAQAESKAAGAVAVGEVPVVTRRDPILDALYKGTDPLTRES